MDNEILIDKLDDIYSHLFNASNRDIITYEQYVYVYNIITEKFKEIYPPDSEIYKSLKDGQGRENNKKRSS